MIDASTVVERYTIEGVLGEGGTAIVYRVRHNQLGTPFALKVVMTPSRTIRDRVLREGQIQGALRHPNIVSVTDVVEVDGQPGLVMELVQGPSLEGFLQRRSLTLDQTDVIARGVLAGVAYAHKNGFIHRDLKPGNILLSVTDEGIVPKVADFGLAKLLAGETSGQRTRSGVSMGTPSYMAPEQVRDAKSVDQRADVWALGVVFYELLCGERPFKGEDLVALFNAITQGQCVPIRQRRPDLAHRMVSTIEAALRVERNERPSDAGALAAIWWPNENGETPSKGPWEADSLDIARSLGPTPLTLIVPTPSRGGNTWVGTPDGTEERESNPSPTGDASVTTLQPQHDAVKRRLSGGTAIAAIAATATVVGIALFVAWAWWAGRSSFNEADAAFPQPAPSATAEVALIPAPLPHPAPADPAPVSEPPGPPPKLKTEGTRPEAPSAPIHPNPTIAAAPPASAPEPIATEPPATASTSPAPQTPPSPDSAGPARGNGRVTVSGVKRAYLVEGKNSYGLEDVNPGRYQLVVVFAEGRDPTPMLYVDVAAGETAAVQCDAELSRCAVR